MATIRIKSKATTGGVPGGLTRGELAVNLADKILYVGAATAGDPAIYLSGVQTFNGLTGAVGGVCGSVANTFSALQSFNAGVCAYGATFSNFIVCKQGIYLSPGGINFMDGSGNVQTDSSLWQPGGDKSIAVGRGAIAGGLPSLSNTENNVAVGYFAGAYYGSGTVYLTGASGSIFIGADTRANANDQVNQIVIGTSSIGDGSNTTVIGNSQITSTRVYGLLSTNGGVSAAGATFGGLVSALAGVSASGATLGTLVVSSGISASGGVTFHNNVWVGGLLTANGGISAAGGVTFANNVYVGQTLSLGGNLVKNGALQYLIQSVGTTSDLPFVQGVTTGSVVFVSQTNYDGLYVLRLVGSTPLWSRVNGNLPADINGDGVVDGIDLAGVLAAYGASTGVYSWSGTPLQMGISDNKGDAFEIKVFGVATGKKSSALKITSDEAVPQIYMKAGTVRMDSDLEITPTGDYTTTISQVTGVIETGFIHATGFTAGGKGSTFDGNLTVGNLLTLNGGLSAGGATFTAPVYMGATLTMNSNIRFNSGYGITGGFVDAGWY